MEHMCCVIIPRDIALNSVLRKTRKNEKIIFAPCLNFTFHDSVCALSLFLESFAIFSACSDGVTISGNSGKIYSPGFPNQFAADTTCSYTINMDSNVAQTVIVSMALDLQGSG